jgi:indole-3-glycerol phosphate synthase
MATRAAPILERIVESRRAAIQQLKVEAGSDGLRRLVGAAVPPRDFGAAITGPGDALRGSRVALIAECKERSPSGGLLQQPYDPVGLARRYAAGGAAAISVLTEPEFFGGSLDHLRAVRAATELPVLCKDFILDPVQVMGARAAGADAVLLIVAILEDEQLLTLQSFVIGLGMQPVVEVHNEAELERALAAAAPMIGINNRDLTRMRTDRATTARLRPLIPADRIVISESGIEKRDDIEALLRLRVDAALVGESLLRAEDAEAKLRELTG